MTLAVVLLLVVVAAILAWLARLDCLVQGVLKRERDEAERLRDRGL